MLEKLVRVVAIALAIFAASCSSSTPTASSAGFTTETFVGSTMPPSGIGVSHIITVTGVSSPNVNVTLTQAGPLLPTTRLFVNIADLLASGACLPHWSQEASPSNTPQLSGAMAPGKYCIIVADAGGAAPVSYTVVVSHL